MTPYVSLFRSFQVAHQMYVTQLKALIAKNVRSTGVATFLLLIGLPFVITVLSLVLAKAVASNEKKIDAKPDRMGLTNFLYVGCSYCEARVYYTPATEKTTSVMTRLLTSEPVIRDVVPCETKRMCLENGYKANDPSLVSFMVTFDDKLSFGVFEMALMDANAQTVGHWVNETNGGSVHLSYSLLSSIGQEKLNLPMSSKLMPYELRKYQLKNLTTNGIEVVKTTRDWYNENNIVLFILTTGQCIALLSFLCYVLLTVSEEKQSGMFGFLRQLNMRESAYWLSLFITFLAVGFLTSVFQALFWGFSTVANDIKFDIEFVDCLFVFTAGFVLNAARGAFLSSLTTRSAVIKLIIVLEILTSLISMYLFLLPLNDYTLSDGYTYFRDAWISHGLSTSPVTFCLFSIMFPFFSSSKFLANYNAQTQEPSMSYGGDDSWYIKQLPEEENVALVLLPLFGSMVFFTFAWYFSQVQADPDSTHKKSAFFMFRRGKKKITPNNDDLETKLAEKSATEQSLVVHKLSKLYKTSSAVRELSFSMKAGQCYCVLGQNGSGKTTLIKMLSGAITATTGEAFLFGHSVKDDVNEIYKTLGCCHQEDMLWANMTPVQHIRIVSMLRGITVPSDSEMTELLSQVDLQHVRNRPVKTFSGGMKRRMCLVLSFIGSPKILFLDEVTTGLDPVSRRRAWAAIQKVKKDKIVILTTHDMEEADALGDHVFIMHRGYMIASASSLFLKNHYGGGYNIRISSAVPETLALFEKLAQKYAPSSSILSKNESELVLNFPKENLRQIVKFLKVIQASDAIMKQDSTEPIMEWSVANTTLEQVFLNIAKQEMQITALGDEDQIKQKKVCGLCKVRPAEDITVFSKQNVAIFLPKLICMQCANPALTSSQSTGLNSEENAELSEAVESIRHALKHKTDAQSNRDLPGGNENVQNRLPFSKQIRSDILATLRKDYAYERKSKKLNCCTVVLVSILLFLILLIFPSVASKSSSSQLHYSCYNATTNATKNGLNKANFCSYTEFMNGLDKFTDKCEMPSCVSTKKMIAASLSQPSNSNANSLTQLLQFEPELWFDVLSSMNLPSRLENVSNSVVKFVKISNATGKYKEKFVGAASPSTCESNTKYQLDLTTNNGSWTGFPFFGTADVDVTNGMPNITHHVFVDYSLASKDASDCVAVTFPRTLLSPLALEISSHLYSNLDIEGHIYVASTMQVTREIARGDFFSIQAILFLLSTMALFPRIADIISLEKNKMIYSYALVFGMTRFGYWFGHFLFYFISLGLLNMITLIIIGAKDWFHSQNNVGDIFGAVILWTASTILTALCIGTVSQSRIQALSFSFVVLIAYVILGAVFINLSDEYTFWIPSISFVRILQNSVTQTGRSSEKYFASLVLSSIILFAIAMFYSRIQEQVFIWRKAFFSRFHKQREDVEKGPDQADATVLAEAKRIRENFQEELKKSAILLRDVDFSYDNNRLILNSLTLSIRRGEIYALLGSNGCGKTTLISLLLGLNQGTKGDIRLLGEDIGKTIIGLCPQFDALNPVLTVEETLLFYVTLREPDRRKHKKLVREMAEFVGLDGEAFIRPTKSLSGGMRRRLSVAIATTGFPPTLILDEPSTGIDAHSRQDIWEIINKIKQTQKTTVLFTTHSMVEADYLATRIGIMENGSLKCLGSSVSLKNKYGDGFHMQFTFSLTCSSSKNQTDVENEVMKKLTEEFTEAVDVQKKIIVFQEETRIRTRVTNDSDNINWYFSVKMHLKAQKVNLALIVDFFANNTENLSIAEWSINPASLEDVFHKMVQG